MYTSITYISNQRYSYLVHEVDRDAYNQFSHIVVEKMNLSFLNPGIELKIIVAMRSGRNMSFEPLAF